MDRAAVIRAMSVYVPVLWAAIAGIVQLRSKRQTASCVAGAMWCLPALIAIQLWNLRAGWWTFHAEGGLWRGMPVDLLLGWAVLWGVLPATAFRRTPIALVGGLLAGLDLVAMPLCGPVVELSNGWLWGEAAAVAIVLVPSLIVTRWTFDGTHLGARAAMLVTGSAGVFLLAMPEMIFALRPGAEWTALFASAGLKAQVLAAVGLLGVSAAQEFASRGGGTPFPFDPPVRLVTSGVYRYVANPMQVSCALSLLVWSAALWNPWMAVAAVGSVVYSEGLARWDEGEDLRSRFGARWERYAGEVPRWRIRWRPWSDSVARLYIAQTCGPCSEVRRWFEARGFTGMEIVAAEQHPGGPLTRITYHAGDGSAPETGVRAIARGLEHIHLGWVLAGAALRLPVIADLAQVVADAVGFGPRECPWNGVVPGENQNLNPLQ